MNEIQSAIVARNLILVLIQDHPKAILLLRMARKRAQERNANWRAVFIETPAHQKYVDDGSQERILRLLTSAQQLGGQTEHFEAPSIEKGMELICLREQAQLDLVIIGSTENSGRFSRFRMMPWIRTVQSASQRAQVEIVPLSGQTNRRSFSEFFNWRALRFTHFIYACGSVGISYLIATFLEKTLPPALFRMNDYNIALIFMISCAFVAGKYGLLPGLFASILSFATMNYYFTLPYHVLKIFAVTDLINMALFLSAAVLISLFTSQTRGYAEKANKRELSTQVLFTLYRVASESFTRQQAVEKLQKKLEKMLGVDVAFFMPQILDPTHINLAAPLDLDLNDNDIKTMESCWRDSKVTGLASPNSPGSQWRFEPMISSSGEIGVIAVRPKKKKRIEAWFGTLLTAIADQTANVLEHIEMERSMEAGRMREEREKLRSMLLSSVSHDLKTPLAGIIGALSVHQSLGDRLSPDKRNELLESSLEEAQRLDSFITNILDMTRLESGNIKFKQEWYSARMMVDNVTKRLRHRLKKHQLVVHNLPADVEIFADVIMTEQVMQNILDNACKYTEEGTQIDINCVTDPEHGFLFSMRDHGKGLPEEKINLVFDKYARLHKKDSQVAGTGLGLAISKAIVEAQHGWIKAENHPDGGAIFTLCLPQFRTAPTQQAEEKTICNS